MSPPRRSSSPRARRSRRGARSGHAGPAAASDDGEDDDGDDAVTLVDRARRRRPRPPRGRRRPRGRAAAGRRPPRERLAAPDRAARLGAPPDGRAARARRAGLGPARRGGRACRAAGTRRRTRARRSSSAPPSVQLDFNEPVEVSFGAVRVYDEDGERVDERRGRPSRRHVRAASRSRLRDGLGAASTPRPTASSPPTATRSPAASRSASASAVTARRDSARRSPTCSHDRTRRAGRRGRLRRRARPALRRPAAAGRRVRVFRLLVWPAGLLGALAAAGWLVAAAVVGLVSALAGIALQGALGAGVTLGHALDGTVHRGLARHPHRRRLAAALGDLGVARASYPRAVPRPRVGALRWLLALAAAASRWLGGTLPYAGPRRYPVAAGAADREPTCCTCSPPATGSAASCCCSAAYWPRRAPRARGRRRTRRPRRFSRLALPAIACSSRPAAHKAWFYLGSRRRRSSTARTAGRSSPKIVLVGAHRRARTRSRRGVSSLVSGGHGSAPAAGDARRGRARGARASPRPPSSCAPRRPPRSRQGRRARSSTSARCGSQMDIEPAETGPTTTTSTCSTADRRPDRPRRASSRCGSTQRDKDIGPIKLDIPRKGPAHYELLDQALGVPGRWEIQVDARVSDFDAYTAETDFEVRSK